MLLYEQESYAILGACFAVYKDKGSGSLEAVKAVSNLVDEHRAQLLNYLNATGFQLGLLVNFGHHPKLEYERLANTRCR